MQTYKQILPTTQELMRFRVFDGAEDVFRAELPANNAAFLGLEEILRPNGTHEPGIKRIEELDLHQSCYARFRMSGTTGTYRVWRTA